MGWGGVGWRETTSPPVNQQILLYSNAHAERSTPAPPYSKHRDTALRRRARTRVSSLPVPQTHIDTLAFAPLPAASQLGAA
jgi:hypothetical protein